MRNYDVNETDPTTKIIIAASCGCRWIFHADEMKVKSEALVRFRNVPLPFKAPCKVAMHLCVDTTV